MSSLKKSVLQFCAAVLGAAVSPGVSATAMAAGDIGFSDLQINPASGSLQLLDSWTLSSFSEAGNSLGAYMPDYNSSYPGGSAPTNAAVAWANAQGAATASSPPAPPDLAVTGSAASSVDAPGCPPNSAYADGHGILSNSLDVTGGMGAVAVNVSADIAGLLNLYTDSCGLQAYSEVIFSLQILGLPNTGNGPQNSQVLFYDQPYTIGPSDQYYLPISLTLANTVTLDYGANYTIQIEVDSESSGLVPEPATPALMLAGAAVPLIRRRVRQAVSTPSCRILI